MAPPLAVHRIATPDGDELQLHTLDSPGTANHLLLLHGLEGSPASHYVRGIFAAAASRGWSATLLVFRGCGDSPNRARRFYHSGETTDLDLAIRTLRARRPGGRLHAAGVSLGGNVLLKWLGEQHDAASVRAAAAVSVPYDLEAGARTIAQGVSRIYDRHFLRSLRWKALAKLAIYPDLFDPGRVQAARTVYAFDDAVTAPVHGFVDARDYYSRSSSLHFLERVRVPTLLLSAADDPFLPPSVLDRVRAVARTNSALEVEFHERGGHVGFVSGAAPWTASYYLDHRLFEFFEAVEARA